MGGNLDTATTVIPARERESAKYGMEAADLPSVEEGGCAFVGFKRRVCLSVGRSVGCRVCSSGREGWMGVRGVGEEMLPEMKAEESDTHGNVFVHQAAKRRSSNCHSRGRRPCRAVPWYAHRKKGVSRTLSHCLVSNQSKFVVFRDGHYLAFAHHHDAGSAKVTHSLGHSLTLSE